MGFWADLKEAAKNQIEHGGKVSDWFCGIRIISIIAGAICSIGLVLGIISVFSEISDLTRQNIQENCEHRRVDEDTMYLDRLNEVVVAKCKDCGLEKYLESTKTTEVLYKPTCLSTGSEEITVIPVDYPEYVFKTTKTLYMTSCKDIEIVSPRVASTCTTKGTTETTKCTLCKTVYPGTSLPLLEHNLEEVGYVAPTCTSTGLTSIKDCSECDYTEGTQEVIELLPHTYLDEEKYTVEATYDRGEHIIRVCHECSHEELLEYTSLPEVSEYFEYELDDESKTATLKGVKTSNKELVIPGEINTYPVNEIPSTLFKENTIIEKITIEEGIKTIGKEAFKNCSSLKEINFPTSLESIEESAFENCDELRKVVVDTGIIKTKAFSSCSNLRIVETGKKVRLQDNSFYDCEKLIFFKFGNYANGRRNVFDKEGTYGSTIDDIDSYVTLTSGPYSNLDDYYKGETSEDVIIIKDGFYYYKDKNNDNLLLSIDRPLETNIEIPSYIDYVTGNTFRGMENQLDSLIVPDSVTRIYPTDRFYKNLKIYFKGEDCLGENREIGAKITDPSTNEEITYKSVRYYYSETNQETGGPYWYYDENKNIVEHEYPYINFGSIDYFAFGDGFTYGYNGSTYNEETYASLVMNDLGLLSHTVKGSAKVSYAYIENGKRLYNYIPTYSMSSPEVISVMGGINDFLNNVPLGDENNQDLTTFYVSVQHNIDYFVQEYGNEFLFFITPLKQFNVDQTNNVGASLEDYVNIIKKVCELNNIPVLDLYNLIDYSEITDPASDGLYPTEEFTKEVIVPEISKFIEENYKQFVLENS